MIYGGIDIGGTCIKFGFVDESGNMLCKDLLPVSAISSYEEFVDSLDMAVANLGNTLDDPSHITGFGVGCPGRIDVEEGKVIWLRGKLEYLENQLLGFDLASRFGRPVVCDNDVNSTVLGETHFGKAKNCSNVIGLTFGSGIGGAIIHDGQLLRGKHFAVGHFGFMSHDPNGGDHVSGNPGAAELHASHLGILAKVKNELATGRKTSLGSRLNDASHNFGFKDVYSEAAHGDDLAKEILERLEKEVTVLIANLLFAFDPDMILIGGGLIEADDEIVARISEGVKSRVAFIPKEGIRLEKMSSYQGSGILGGAALAISELELE